MDKDSGEIEIPSIYKPKTAKFKHTAARLKNSDRKSSIILNSGKDWQEVAADICGVDANAVETNLVDLRQALLVSKTAEALFAAVGNVSLQYDSQTQTSQMYVVGDKIILAFNPLHSKGALSHLLSREIRRAHQHRVGALVNPMSFEPEEAVLVNRAQQADTLIATIKISWELKLVGESDAWDFLCTSFAADEAHAFEVMAQKDFRTLNSGEAARAVYDRFFATGTKTHDKRVIQQMLLSERYLRGDKKFQIAGHEIFLALGDMPFSRNYLALPGKTPPTDARYKMVEDRSNANFLWFIKFECSFQKKEAEMVKESVVRSAEIVDFSVWMLKAGRTLVSKPTA